MATYLYETVDPSKPVEHFEIQQSMRDEALQAHPETGVAIRRVISGGFGVLSRAGQSSGLGTGVSTTGRASGGAAQRCGTGCGCH
ncbi:MAG: zinc ribbon domain-containing protein [Verrucomicrobiota bacterium]